jgi:phosphoadenosine phosphosulfate reductase
LLPEQREIVAHVKSFAPNFVHIQGDVNAWIAKYGLPTDLLPHSAHPVGQVMGEHGAKLVGRYDCCGINLMAPLWFKVREDGNTLLIRGTKAVDMRRLPLKTGDAQDGIELWYPLQGWTNDQVFAYLREAGAPISRVYQYVTNSPECARCSAWWSEGRADYLRRYHPDLWRDYSRRLLTVVNEITGPLKHLRREADGAIDAPDLSDAVLDAATGLALARGLRVLQGNRLGATDAEHVARLLDFMAAPERATVLDVGCGFGEVAWLMRQARPDLGFVLLNRNTQQLAQCPRGEGFRPVYGDMHAMPLETASVDGAMFLYSLCHADPLHALREAARVVRPGGFAFIYDYERLAGDNALMEQRLCARAYRRQEFLRFCAVTGWRPVAGCAPGGDDSLFRDLVGDGYDAIFGELQPVIWKLETV